MPEKAGGEETIDTDVLVVGMGGSGTYTALRAAECGAKVLAIDKQGRYGGTTALTSQIESINPPRIKEEYNNGEDYTDAEAMKAAWI
jgi:fumarate reductase flavoprotein subunit